MALLALGRHALLSDEGLGVDGLRLPVGVLAAEHNFNLRIGVAAEGHKITSLAVGNE